MVKLRSIVVLGLMLFFSISVVAQSPELFLTGIVSTKYAERDMTIASGGKHLLYSAHTYKNEKRVIVESFYTQEKWTEPTVVSFSGKYKDIEPMFFPNENLLFFSSNRPLNASDSTLDYNIWYVERTADGWRDPMALDSLINSPADEYYPSIVNDGSLYFTAERIGNKGTEDIYYSAFVDGVYQAPVSLDAAINTKTYEFNAFVDPEERYIIFSSYGRPDDIGGGDLYISWRKDGQWLAARNLGNSINSTALDYCPFVSLDGKTLYFTSNRVTRDFADLHSSVDNIRKAMDGILNGFDNVYFVPIESFLEK